jgi:hypothetical protein
MTTYKYDRFRNLWKHAAPMGVAVVLWGALLGGAPSLAQAEDAYVFEADCLTKLSRKA